MDRVIQKYQQNMVAYREITKFYKKISYRSNNAKWHNYILPLKLNLSNISIEQLMPRL